MRNSAPLSTPVNTCLAATPWISRRDNATRVSAVNGTLPVASRPTMRQSIVWLKPWIRLPPVLVAAA